jgi:hypothetical protein
MNAHVDHLIDEVLALPPAERSAVMLTLIESLGGEDEAGVAKAWADEIHQRKHDLQSGATTVMPWAEAQARLNAL